jgi:hypothetical protein
VICCSAGGDDLSNPPTALVASALSWSGLIVWTISWFVLMPLFGTVLGKVRRAPATLETSSGDSIAWAWSVLLVLVTIAVHVSGIALIALVLPRFWSEDVTGRKTFLDTIPGTVLVITAIAFTLASLHGIEAFIWAIVCACGEA